MGLGVTSALAMTPEQWQADLQNQMTALRPMLPNLTLQGDIRVTTKGDMLEATLPAASGRDQSGIVWNAPVMLLRTPAADPVVRSLDIVPQGTINILQNGTTRQLSVQHIKLESDTAKKLQLTLDQLQTQQASVPVLAMGKAVISYKTKLDPTLTLAQLFSLLQQELGQEPLWAEAHITDIQINNKENALRIQDVVAQAQIEPQSGTDRVTVRNAITAKGITPAGFNILSAFIPQDLELVGTVVALPKIVLKGAATTDEMQKAMAAAQTRIILDHIQSQTALGAVLKGNGEVRPSVTTPTGLVGRITLTIDKIQEAIVQAQQAPAEQANGVLGLMLLQGLGHQEQGSTRFVIDMTPDGQTLVNGQDFGAVTRLFGAKSGNSPVPTAPPSPPGQPTTQDL